MSLYVQLYHRIYTSNLECQTTIIFQYVVVWQPKYCIVLSFNVYLASAWMAKYLQWHNAIPTVRCQIVQVWPRYSPDYSRHCQTTWWIDDKIIFSEWKEAFLFKSFWYVYCWNSRLVLTSKTSVNPVGSQVKIFNVNKYAEILS